MENQKKLMSHSQPTGLPQSLNSMSLSSERSTIDKSAIQRASRLLRKSSLEAISQIVRSLAISAAAGTDSVFCTLLLSWAGFDTPVAFERSNSFASPRARDDPTDSGNFFTPGSAASTLPSAFGRSPTGVGDGEVLEYWRGVCAEERNDRLSCAALSSRESTMIALEIAHRKSLKKAIEYLLACGTITAAPRDIANFIHMHKESLEPRALGCYLGEGGLGSKEIEYWNQLRFTYVRFTSFSGMTLVDG